MSAHRLPENIDQWPRDPYVLLGVTYATSRRDVRKAYARLIRVYKPEHHPDHFRRLRAAFETLDQRAARVEARTAPADEMIEAAPFAEEIAAPAAEARAELLDDEAPVLMSQPVPSPAKDRASLWQEARQGELYGAYSQFARAAQQGQGDEELYARLFWLLRIDLTLDPARDPRDWLVAGVKRCGLRGRLPELYRSEMMEDLNEALHRRADEAIRCSGHKGLLADLVIARWEAAARLERWKVIEQDLAALRERLQDEATVWGRLLLAAIDHLSWAPDADWTWAPHAERDSTVMNCRREAEQLAEHWPVISGDLDQRDGLKELVDACDELARVTNLPADWRKSVRSLLKTSWNQSLDVYRRQLLDLLVPLVSNPIVGLEFFDRLETRCRPALHRLGALIGALFNEGCAGRQPPPAKEMLDRLVDFLVAASKKKYPPRWKKWLLASKRALPFGRRELLMFCLDESISVRQLIDYLAGSLRQDLVQFLAPAENAPLQYMCMAYQAFWA